MKIQITQVRLPLGSALVVGLLGAPLCIGVVVKLCLCTHELASFRSFVSGSFALSARFASVTEYGAPAMAPLQQLDAYLAEHSYLGSEGGVTQEDYKQLKDTHTRARATKGAPAHFASGALPHPLAHSCEFHRIGIRFERFRCRFLGGCAS